MRGVRRSARHEGSGGPGPSKRAQSWIHGSVGPSIPPAYALRV